jgi:hypothetical protein
MNFSASAACGIVGGYNLQKEAVQETETAIMLGDLYRFIVENSLFHTFLLTPKQSSRPY